MSNIQPASTKIQDEARRALSSKLSRRSFLLLSLLSVSCTKNVARQYIERNPLSVSYNFAVDQSQGYRTFTGRALKITTYREETYQNEYRESYGISKKGSKEAGKDFLKNPQLILGCILIWPICLLGLGLASLVTWNDPSRNRLIEKKEEVFIGKTKISESINTDRLEDKDRTISIIISGPNNKKDLILAKTDLTGRFIFNFEEYIRTNNSTPGNYKIEFFHELLENKRYAVIVPSREVREFIPQRSVSNVLPVTTQNTGDWFTFIEYASTVKTGATFALKVYQLYSKYRFTRTFAKLFLVEFFPLFVLTTALETAILMFARWLLEEYGYL